MFIVGLVKMSPSKKTPVFTAESEHYDQLIHMVFRPESATVENGNVVAFVSASAGAGSSSVAREIGRELAGYKGKRILVMAAEKLKSIEKAELEIWLRDCAVSDDNLIVFDAAERLTRTKGGREACLKLLRRHFDYILIDFQSSNATSGLSALAEFTDGVVMVVAAGETRREEIERSRQMIEMAKGRTLGLVLNKRRYPVPVWLYKRI